MTEDREQPPVDENDLQHFVDGRLPASRRDVVEAHLARHPDCARRVREQAAQREALRAALRFKATEAVPGRLMPERLARPRRQASRGGLAIAASIALAALVGASGGWVGRGLVDLGAEGQGRAALAASAHRVFVADAVRPVEIQAAAGDLAVRWLTNRLGRAVQAPDLDGVGFRYLGGRLIPTLEGPAGQLMYDDGAGTRATLFMLPSAVAASPPSFIGIAGLGTVSWADGRFVYILVSGGDRARLEQVAAAARAAMPPIPS